MAQGGQAERVGRAVGEVEAAIEGERAVLGVPQPREARPHEAHELLGVRRLLRQDVTRTGGHAEVGLQPMTDARQCIVQFLRAQWWPPAGARAPFNRLSLASGDSIPSAGDQDSRPASAFGSSHDGAHQDRLAVRRIAASAPGSKRSLSSRAPRNTMPSVGRAPGNPTGPWSLTLRRSRRDDPRG
jgi:hypothetical protein